MAEKHTIATAASMVGSISPGIVGSCRYVWERGLFTRWVYSKSFLFRFVPAKRFGSAMAFVETRLAIASRRGAAARVLSPRNAAKLSWRRTVSR
jgi:hypothetical protein